MNKLLDETAVADVLHVQKATLRQWRWQGRGPRWIKVGSRIRYAEDDLSAWLETQKSGASL